MNSGFNMRTRGLFPNCVTSTIIAVSILFSISNSSLFSQNQVPPLKKKTFTVVIDPGHGGKDPGAVGKISREKDIALAISLKTGSYISSLMNDVKVIYTRTDDRYIDLYRRADIAIENKADLFLSIHVNGNNKSSVYGAESYVMGLSKSQKNLDLAMKENSVILLEDDQDKYGGIDPNDESEYIKMAVFQKEFFNQSLHIASEVQDQLRIRAKRKDGGVRQGPFLVLWRTTMPSVIIETGYITNKEEEIYLNTENGQDIISSAIYRAFKNYKEDTQARTLEEKAGELTDDIITTEKVIVDTLKEEEEDNKEKPKIDSTSAEEISVEVDKKVIDIEESSITKSNRLEFRVQLIASKKAIEPGSAHFKGEQGLNEVLVDGYYKYMTNPVSKYALAQDKRRKLSSKFPGAFVVAFLNGNKIPLQEAIRMDKEN